MKVLAPSIRGGRKARVSATRDPFPDPASFAPMLAVQGDLPVDAGRWSFEYKWDGVRALFFHDGRDTRLFARSGREITGTYPEVQSLGKARGRETVVFDGEIVALDETDRPSFGRLQSRMHVVRPGPSLLRTTPVWYVLFDILHRDGKSLLAEPYLERRRILEEVTLAGPFWNLTPSIVGEGAAMLTAAEEFGMEGIVAKRSDSPYLAGRRSPLWVKTKIVHRQEFVVGGWVPEAESGSADRLGSLLLGYYECGGKLRYAGRVGSGFNAETHARLTKNLRSPSTVKNPFSGPVPSEGVRFVKPRLVVDVEYRRWPDEGLLQHAAYKGIRNDKEAKDVVKEHPQTLSVR